MGCSQKTDAFFSIQNRILMFIFIKELIHWLIEAEERESELFRYQAHSSKTVIILRIVMNVCWLFFCNKKSPNAYVLCSLK